MTTPDPFSADRVPNPDSNNSNEPILNQPLPESPAVPNQAYSDPSTYPGTPAASQDGYASPPPYSPPPTHAQPQYANYQQPPAYAQPQYGGYQQPPPSPPLDGVSIAAFATSLVMLGPVAIILGAIGLGRTRNRARSGRWMAWTGLALGVVATLFWALIWVLVTYVDNTANDSDMWSGNTDTTEEQVTVPGADSYGDDPYLDGLWDACDGGDMAACDALYMDSAMGSEYEEFGDNCGTAGRGAFQIFCDS